MKRVIKIWNWALVLMVAIGIASCDTEDKIYELPDVHNIVCNAGDRPTFTFTAGGDWQLSSDATWCKFITYAGEQLDMSGAAGTHTITLNIGNEGIKDKPTYASITIKMGGQTAVIANVERGADRLYIRLFDITESPISAIELGYVDWIPFYIEGNFRFAATDIPYWVELGVKENGVIVPGAITGAPGESTEAYARIVNDGERECRPITVEDGYTITFSDESGNNTFAIPVVYEGMGHDDLTFTGPTDSTFGWEVSLDGKVFRQQNENTGGLITFHDSLDFSIAARNNEYVVLLIEKVVDRGIPSHVFDAKWMHFDIENMVLTVDATEATRYGMVMALPIGIYNKIRADIAGNIFELDDSAGIELETVKYDYLKYILIEFTQRDFAELGEFESMYIYHSLTTLELPVTKYTNSAVMAEYGVEEAYTCPFVNSIEGKRPGIIIDPRIEHWTTATFDEGRASADVYYNGEKLKISEDEYYLGENKDEQMSLHLWGPNDGFVDNVYVVFNVNGAAKKLLVVTPPVR